MLPVHWTLGPAAKKDAKIRKETMQAVYRKVIDSRPKKYAIRQQLLHNKYGGPGISVVFTPPYHPELQP